MTVPIVVPNLGYEFVSWLCDLHNARENPGTGMSRQTAQQYDSRGSDDNLGILVCDELEVGDPVQLVERVEFLQCIARFQVSLASSSSKSVDPTGACASRTRRCLYFSNASSGC